MPTLPMLYHPTTLILLDDDSVFLSSLSLALSSQFKSRCFTVPEEAQHFLINAHSQQNYLRNKYLQIDNQDWSRFSINVEIASIYREVFNPDRFNKTCILVVDYDMPTTNGLDLARSLKAQMPIKIIMLTGEADQETAVTAFNNKEIDQFLLKSRRDYHEKLLHYIHQLQLEYFTEISAPITAPLNPEGNHPLHDPHFISLFQTLCAERQIMESYLLDESGSFLLVDAAGRKTWLIVRTPADIETFYELATSEPDIPPEVLQSLYNKSKIIFFPPSATLIPPLQDWVICEARQLTGREIYYSVLTDTEGSYLPPEQILSYRAFLDAD